MQAQALHPTDAMPTALSSAPVEAIISASLRECSWTAYRAEAIYLSIDRQEDAFFIISPSKGKTA
jgi:hypothetical protein